MLMLRQHTACTMGKIIPHASGAVNKEMLLFNTKFVLRSFFLFLVTKLLPKHLFITYTTVFPLGFSRLLHFQFILINAIVAEKTYITKKEGTPRSVFGGNE